MRTDNMNWNESLIEPGKYSVVPNKLLIGYKQLGMTAKELLTIVKINRHQQSFNLHHYYLDDPLKAKGMNPQERVVISNKIGKIIKSCKTKRFIKENGRPFNKKYPLGLKYDFTNLNRLIKEKIRLPFYNPVDIRIIAEQTRWDKDVLEFGFLIIPHIFMDMYRTLDITDSELVYMLSPMCQKENVYIDINMFGIPEETLVEKWNSLQSKNIMTFEKAYHNKYRFNFQLLNSKVFLLNSTKIDDSNSFLDDRLSKISDYNKIIDYIDKEIIIEDSKNPGTIDNIYLYDNIDTSNLHKMIGSMSLENIIDNIHIKFNKVIDIAIKPLHDEIKILKTKYENRIKQLEQKLANPLKKLKKLKTYNDIKNPDARRLLKKYNTEMKKEFRASDVKYLEQEYVVEKLLTIEDYLIKEIIRREWSNLHPKDRYTNTSGHFSIFVKSGVLNFLYDEIEKGNIQFKYESGLYW